MFKRSILACIALSALIGCAPSASGPALSTVKNSGGLSEADMRIPFYPGSQDLGENFDQKLKGRRSIGVRRSTTDAPAKVAEFYQQKLANPVRKSRKIGQDEFEVVTTKLADGTQGSVTIRTQNGQTTMTLFTTYP